MPVWLQSPQSDGKAYIDVKLADLPEEDKGSIFCRREKETGFRGLEDIAVFHGVYHDGQSHYYIDGTVNESGRVPILVYDETSGKYATALNPPATL